MIFQSMLKPMTTCRLLFLALLPMVIAYTVEPGNCPMCPGSHCYAPGHLGSVLNPSSGLSVSGTKGSTALFKKKELRITFWVAFVSKQLSVQKKSPTSGTVTVEVSSSGCSLASFPWCLRSCFHSGKLYFSRICAPPVRPSDTESCWILRSAISRFCHKPQCLHWQPVSSAPCRDRQCLKA